MSGNNIRNNRVSDDFDRFIGDGNEFAKTRKIVYEDNYIVVVSDLSS